MFSEGETLDEAKTNRLGRAHASNGISSENKQACRNDNFPGSVRCETGNRIKQKDAIWPKEIEVRKEKSESRKSPKLRQQPPGRQFLVEDYYEAEEI